jgi:hypothetical protein
LREPLVQCGSIKVAPDEDQLIAARVFAPWAIRSTIEEHVHALKDKSIRFPCQTNHTLHTENVSTLSL